MFTRNRRLDAFVGQALQRFIVTLEDGTIVSGVLIEISSTTLVFDDIKLLEEGRDWLPAAGRLYVDRVKVRYCQLVPARGGG
ncbi:hypothetical protein IU500_06970 [Nocardia terpenica]|uniref:hypothetical protein n=1 Tax=Nocardia terpenica TaxID=455432 RepID=UPI001893E3C2|nr:hypothetical protein [Nocardia terpenica]MBF6060518.1 hypothetical protein [Nocardia terpenica]MBF6103778.1 hypothetical protein [Nocardia terpenica]MBF6111848.1 hypothetical protein [Nocardia terpenica]MBF6117999.1 hypothetical protein [Nocardia terpenica]MBF6155275.1 hypothetical protein [Nocardia terpenica]